MRKLSPVLRRTACAALLAALALPSGGLAQQAMDPYGFAATVDLIQDYYIFVQDLAPAQVLESAARGLEAQVPWLYVESGAEGVNLLKPDRTSLIQVQAQRWENLPMAMVAMRRAVQSSGLPLPPHLRLDEAILRGMVASLDKHSHLVSEERAQTTREELRGTYSGIGIQDRVVDEVPLVTAVCPDGPAARAGVLPQDRILTIDGVSTRGMSQDDVSDRLRGPVGSQVTLGIQRGRQQLTLSVPRAAVHWPDGRTATLSSGMTWIQLDRFSTRTRRWLNTELYSLKKKKNLHWGIVLDLRGNGGGTQSYQWLADQFLTHGVLLWEEKKSPGNDEITRKPVRATREGLDTDAPLVLLVDGGTASASERLVGALVANKRAIVLGSRTEGKDTAWKSFNLGSGLSLTLSRERASFPNDFVIPPDGIVPDVALRRMILDGDGLRITPVEGAPAHQVTWVDEQGGWRADADPPSRPDFAAELAQRIVMEARSPERAALLEATARVLPQVQKEEEARLQEALAIRGVPWADPPAGTSCTDGVQVQVALLSPPRAGEVARLDALVTSTCKTTVTRVSVELQAPGTPWDGRVLPVGTLEPGASVHAGASVPVKPSTPTRTDPVRLAVHYNGEPAWNAGSALLTVDAAPSPWPSVSATLDGSKVVFVLENRSTETTPPLDLRFAFPDPLRVRLVDSGVAVDPIPAGGSRTASLAIALQPSAPTGPVDLDLEVRARGWGRRTLPLSLPRAGGPVRVELPTVTLQSTGVPTPGAVVQVQVTAHDDGPLQAVEILHNGRKIHYLPGTEPDLVQTFPLVVQAGLNQVEARVTDATGLRAETELRIWGTGR